MNCGGSPGAPSMGAVRMSKGLGRVHVGHDQASPAAPAVACHESRFSDLDPNRTAINLPVNVIDKQPYDFLHKLVVIHDTDSNGGCDAVAPVGTS